MDSRGTTPIALQEKLRRGHGQQGRSVIEATRLATSKIQTLSDGAIEGDSSEHKEMKQGVTMIQEYGKRRPNNGNNLSHYRWNIMKWQCERNVRKHGLLFYRTSFETQAPWSIGLLGFLHHTIVTVVGDDNQVHSNTRFLS